MTFWNYLNTLFYKQRNEHYKRLKRRDAYSCENLYYLQWRKFRKLLNYCYYKIPYYEKLFKTLDLRPEDITSYKDLGLIPELTKADIAENRDMLVNIEMLKKGRFFANMSSSFGIPVKIYHTIDETEYSKAIGKRAYSWRGREFADKAYYLKAKNISLEGMELWAKQIKNRKPHYLYGNASLLEEFSEFLAEEKIEIKGLKAVVCASELPVDKNLISKTFQVPVFQDYGCQEVPRIAHECSKGNMHLNIDEVLVELVETFSGEKKFVCTPLYVYGMPLLRYNTQDTALSLGESCGCGLAYPVVKIKAERLSDNLLSSSGRLVSGSAVKSGIAAVTSGVRQFQVMQKDLQSVTVKMSVYGFSDVKNEQNICKLFYELMETNLLRINFEYHEHIPTGKDRNFRPVISNVTNNLNYRKNIRYKPLKVCK